MSWILALCAVTLAPRTRAFTNAAATSAFERPTSLARNRNCRLRFDTSIVSMSTTSMLPKPRRARFLRSSQPRPPAPMTRMRHSVRNHSRASSHGLKPSVVRLPERMRNMSTSRY
eukprot:Amastigsp_a176762_80.p3 type:complete len:115 gc:universal Amastigsp_a176762_80:938-1282(+)